MRSVAKSDRSDSFWLVTTNFLKSIFGADDVDADELREGEAPESELDERGERKPAPRSITDAWDRMSDQNRAVEKRLQALEASQAELLDVTKTLAETAREQLEVLHYLGKFHEASEKRQRELESAFHGVPEVLRSLPDATRQQAQRLSEIAARLYEKAQDNTVTALKSAQANHQRAIEDLIEKSLGASRRLMHWAMILTAAVLAVVLFVYFDLRQAP